MYLLGGGAVIVVAAVAVIVFAVVSRDSGGSAASPNTKATDSAAQAVPATPYPAASEPTSEPAVTLVEFGDFQCSHCAQFALTIGRRVKDEFVSAGRIRFEFRHFAFIGEESFRAAEATECAREQGRFWDYHDIVFENWNTPNTGAYSDDNLKGFASRLGLDSSSFDACLDGGKHRDKVLSDRREGERLGVNSTPTLFLNGRKVEGVNYEELARLIELEIAAAE